MTLIWATTFSIRVFFVVVKNRNHYFWCTFQLGWLDYMLLLVPLRSFSQSWKQNDASNNECSDRTFVLHHVNDWKQPHNREKHRNLHFNFIIMRIVGHVDLEMRLFMLSTFVRLEVLLTPCFSLEKEQILFQRIIQLKQSFRSASDKISKDLSKITPKMWKIEIVLNKTAIACLLTAWNFFLSPIDFSIKKKKNKKNG